MMKLHSLYIMLCLCCLPALTSCRDDAALPDGQSNVPAKTLLVLNFTIDGKDAASRTGADDTPEHPEADWENNIVFFHLFIRHADGTWEEPIILSAIDDNTTYEIELDQADLEGDFIYLGANLSTQQATTFMQQAKEASQTMPPYNLAGEGFNLVTDFSPYSTYESNPGRNHIAMFCTEAGTPVKTDATLNTYTVDFDLKRMVAKVLVTCKTDDQGYVPVGVNEDNSDFKGWIRQEDVKYLVNGLNRKAYIMQQINGSVTAENAYAYVIDPNNALSATVSESDFFFQQVEGKIDNGFFRPTVQFDKTRLSTDENYTGSNPYTEGIYCPENTFAIPDAGLILEGEQAQVTHVNVAARFTPGKLHVGTAEDLKIFIANDTDVPAEIRQAVADLNITGGVVDCPSEAVARQLLASSLEMAANNNGFPSGTYFYHHTDKTFYTYGGMVEALGHDVSISDIETSQGRFGDFVPYLDGWGYYYTYVDNRKDNYGKPADTKAYQYGQVERNRYYILNITKFTRPGSSVTNPEYIQVHTYSFPWEYGGEGEITLDPNDEVQQ